MYTLLQYLNTLNDPTGLTRTLGELVVCRDAAGRMRYTAGNSAAVFRIRHAGRTRSLRCFLHSAPNRAAIYGDRLLRNELYLYTAPDRGEWVDVAVDDWIEGPTLGEALAEAAEARDTVRLAALSRAFDRLGAAMVADDRAHGDLKPDNLIVAPDGTLQPIDFDAAFLPEFAGMRSPELGTAAYRHPARSADDFDASLDDYPVALISTALRALALDPTLYDRYRHRDGLLFEPQRIATDPALHEVLELFERRCMGLRYRIARLLRSPTLRLHELGTLLGYVVAPKEMPATIPELYVENGLWGFRTTEKCVIPPVYDCGFDFTEGLAAVRLGASWHYIDPCGRPVIHCPECEAVKPFRNGRAKIRRNGRLFEIDRSGHEYKI